MAYRIPAAGELGERLDPVLSTVYLIYTEGHTATAGDDLVRLSAAMTAFGSSTRRRANADL